MDQHQYQDFTNWAETQDLEFPCTVAQFSTCVANYAWTLGDRSLIESLCTYGMGPNWHDPAIQGDLLFWKRINHD